MTATRGGAESSEKSLRATRWFMVGLCRCGSSAGPRRPRCRCINVHDTPIDTPDLAIYSQSEQITIGAIPTWDSPDIITNDLRPLRLRTEAEVTIRNLSTTTSAVNALVHFYTSPFGIGMRPELRITRIASLGPADQVTLLFPFPQAVLAGDPRIGVYVTIVHPTDRNTLNNSGAQVVDGAYTSESGRSFDVGIPILNDSVLARDIQLSVQPTDLLASVTPSTQAFAPSEQIIANLHIDVPGALIGTPGNEIDRAVTVLARTAEGEVIGGVTRIVRIDS